MTDAERDNWFAELGRAFYETEGMRNAKTWYESCTEHLPDVLRKVWDRASKEATEGRLPSQTLLSEEKLKEIESLRDRMKTNGLPAAAAVLGSLITERQTLVRLLQDSEGIDAYKRGWDARIEYGEWTTLGELRPGDVCELEGVGTVQINWIGSPRTTVSCSFVEGDLQAFLEKAEKRARKVKINW